MTKSYGQLHGTYTIGKGGTEDYPNITAAVNSLINYGITSAVYFKISPGTYEEQIYLPYILGTEVHSPVFFEAANGDSSSVLITFKPTIDTIAYTLGLENTRHIVFRNLSFGTDTLIGRLLELGRNCLNIQILNCQFIGQKGGNELVLSPCLDGAFNQYILFRNNLFVNGSHGINLCQGGQSPDINTFIENNVFLNQSIAATYLKNHEEALVLGNTIINNSNSSGFLGFNFENCLGSTNVRSNKIYMSDMGMNSFGIRFFKSSGSLGDEVLIANNFIYQNTRDWCVGIHLTSNDYTNIYHNSIHITGYSTGSAGISSIFGTHSTLRNNNLVNSADGYSLLLSGAQSLVNDHNNLYNTGMYIANLDGNLISDLSAWKTASQQGSGSLSVNPEFCNDSNLHTFSDTINNKGIYILSLNTDIDGELRNNPPDIGADEYSPFHYYIGPDLSACTSDSILLDAGKYDGYLWEDLSTDRYYTLHAFQNMYQKDTHIVRINKNGCWFSDSIQTEFFATPEFDLGKDSIFCFENFSSYQLNGPKDYPVYNWHDGNHGPVYSLLKPGDTGTVRVFLTVVDSNGCSGSDTIQFHFILCNGLEESNQTATVKIWPNPTLDMLNIHVNKPAPDRKISLCIYDHSGQLIMQKKLDFSASSVDLSSLGSGIYILKLYQNDSLLGMFKTIKQ